MQAWYTSWETTPHTQSDTLYTKWKKTCHWYFVSFQWPEKNTCPVNEGYRVQVLVESKSKKDGIAGIWEKMKLAKRCEMTKDIERTYGKGISPGEGLNDLPSLLPRSCRPSQDLSNPILVYLFFFCMYYHSEKVFNLTKSWQWKKKTNKHSATAFWWNACSSYDKKKDEWLQYVNKRKK